MSSSVPAAPSGASSTDGPASRVVNPWKNPSYPARTHWSERPVLEEKLRSWDRKIDALAQKLAVLGNRPERPAYERIYHQMLGARDQLAEAVRRLPGEAGALYHEDQERLRNAESALERLTRQWDAVRS